MCWRTRMIGIEDILWRKWKGKVFLIFISTYGMQNIFIVLSSIFIKNILHGVGVEPFLVFKLKK